MLKVNQFSKRGAFNGDDTPSLPSLKDAMRSYAMVMLSVRKQLYRCSACRRQSRENPTPHAYPQSRREEILHAYPERSSPGGLTARLGSLAPRCHSGSKKERSFLPSARPGWPPIQKMPLPPRWNPIDCGPLCSKKSSRSGCGLPCVARRDRWSPMRWAIGVKRRASGYGRAFQTAIARDNALRISGRHTRR